MSSFKRGWRLNLEGFNFYEKEPYKKKPTLSIGEENKLNPDNNNHNDNSNSNSNFVYMYEKDGRKCEKIESTLKALNALKGVEEINHKNL